LLFSNISYFCHFISYISFDNIFLRFRFLDISDFISFSGFHYICFRLYAFQSPLRCFSLMLLSVISFIAISSTADLPLSYQSRHARYAASIAFHFFRHFVIELPLLPR